jgi:2-dehydro-3-deoxy-D-arabinonate dehydratase
VNICRFESKDSQIRVGLIESNSTVIDLSPAGINELESVLENQNFPTEAKDLLNPRLPRLSLSKVRLRAPVERQEVWAAGVTYLRSKKARMEESEFSANAYDRVYDAERPELFFKSLPGKVVADGEPVGIRHDARWNVPEPELALVFNSRARLVGYTIGNDMSARDIEGENLLYLPQAKIYHRSCALGPWINIGASEAEARQWKIRMAVQRKDQPVFVGETVAGQIKRGFNELADFLFRSQLFPGGAILLTGTGVVPPDDFTLQAGDLVQIDVPGIGTLRNPVVRA